MALYVQGLEKGGAKLTENILTNFDLNFILINSYKQREQKNKI